MLKLEHCSHEWARGIHVEHSVVIAALHGVGVQTPNKYCLARGDIHPTYVLDSSQLLSE